MLDNPPPPVETSLQRVARILLSIALLALGLFIVQGFFRALVWAGVLAVATWPLYQKARWRVPPGKHNILLPMAFTAGAALVFIGPIGVLAYQLGTEGRAASDWINQTREHGAPLPDALGHLPMFQAQVTSWWQDNMANPAGAHALLEKIDRESVMSIGRRFGAHLAHDAVLFTFTIVTLFFLYRDGETVIAQMQTAGRRLFGPGSDRLAAQIIASVHGTVDGLVLVGLGTGLVLGVFYVVAGVPHPALLGAASAIGAMIPLGATVVLMLACVLLMAIGHSTAAIVLLIAGYIVVFAADHFVRPNLIGGATKLPFLWVLLGILGGVETIGLLGLFIGPATMAALILLWREWTGNARTTPTS